MPLQITTEYQSNNYRDREENEPIQFLVFHYTAVPLRTTLGISTNNVALAEEDREYFVDSKYDLDLLCNNEVSSHYVIAEDGKIFNLVNEQHVAYHLGESCWNGSPNINSQSIGIEQVHHGYQWLPKWVIPEDRAVKIKGSNKTWCTFNDEQITQTIELCKSIIAKYNIKPFNIIGHSDIACGRKLDPGPLFPWKRLAEEGIGIWYDLSESNIQMPENPEDALKLAKEKLNYFGYDCWFLDITDEISLQNVIKAFQMHFRPSNIDGIIDLECLQILDSLCQRKLRYEDELKKAETPKLTLKPKF